MEKKDIEIPFGAYDSELGGFEYTIPEGYKAEIRDGKVVVRKTESEDEKIRKWCISHFRECFRVTKDNAEYQEYLNKKVIPWLEKQGGHAKFINGIQVGDKVTRNEDGVLVNLSQLNRVAKKDEKQGKQKDILEDAILDSNKDGLIADTIRYKREKQGKQKSAETEKGTNGNDREIPISAWSEEDEKILNLIIARLYSHLNVDAKEYDKDYDWLESLKDRVLPQPKQEWSEEDKRMLRDTIAYVEAGIKFDGTPQLNWLKSLRPQNTWKPSDEQIKALSKLEEMHVLEHEKNQENAHLYMMVKSIREQLLKLMEE